MKLVLDAFARHCAERPDDAAIVDPDRSALTWSELAVRVAAMRALIAARTAPGARVCVSVPSGSAFWIAVLAAASSGRMPCLLPDPIPGMIADRIPAELGADALLVNAAMVADSARMPPREGSAAEPIGAILLSSGTTGHSRFVVRSVEAIDLIARTLVDEGLSAPGDIVASFLPMAHAYGFEHAFLAPILAGARVHALGAFSLEKATDALAAGATAMPLVPITAKALAEARPSAPRLRCAVTAGTVLPKAVRTEFERAFGVQLVDLYGASELGTIWLDRGDGGRPVRGVEITLVGGDGSSGEIAVRSVCMLTGVIDANGLCQPATEDGCFRTGDLGARAPDGSLRVTGRIKLVFDVGGLKVNPIEIEQALELHPSIHRALVKPVSADSALQRVAAEIELRDGAPEPTFIGLRAHLAPLVPSHAIPRSIVVVAHLPTTASGKLLRETLANAPAATAAPAVVIAPVMHRPNGLEQRGEREKYTKTLFDLTAHGYDNSSGAAFMRSGRWYRRRMLVMAGLKTGGTHLDVGSGTGLCAALAQEIVGPTGRVVAIDPSTGMLEVARRRGVRETVEGRAESLPFPDASFDVVSMSYMLRHIDDLMLAFGEARRVLRPCGRIVIFEVTRPTRIGVRKAFDLSMYWVVPAVGVVASGRSSTFQMMQYWADTIKAAARPERIVEALERSGFVGTRHLLELGVFSCYRGSAPFAAPAPRR